MAWYLWRSSSKFAWHAKIVQSIFILSWTHFRLVFALFLVFYDHLNVSSVNDSDQCSVSDDYSEFNFIPGNYFVIESEIMEASDGENGADDRDEKQAVLKLLMLNHIFIQLLWNICCSIHVSDWCIKIYVINDSKLLFQTKLLLLRSLVVILFSDY